jgi:hypothetical protein
MLTRSSRLTFWRPKLIQILSDCLLTPTPAAAFPPATPHQKSGGGGQQQQEVGGTDCTQGERIWSKLGRHKVERGLW